jgi:hypothetical protein
VSVKAKKGKGKFDAMNEVIKDKSARKLFNDKWTPELLSLFCTDMGGEYQLRGSELSLLFEGPWVRCSICKSVHRPVPGQSHCLDWAAKPSVSLIPRMMPSFWRGKVITVAR